MDRENKGSAEAFWTAMFPKEGLTRSSAIPWAKVVHQRSPASPGNGTASVSLLSSWDQKQPWEAWPRYRCCDRFQITAAGTLVQLHVHNWRSARSIVMTATSPPEKRRVEQVLCPPGSHWHSGTPVCFNCKSKDDKQVIKLLKDLFFVSLKERNCQGLEVICLCSEILVSLQVKYLFA